MSLVACFGKGIKRGFVDQFKKDSFLITHWELERLGVCGFTFSLASSLPAVLEGTKEV
jgi:hypothetical protein